MSVIELVGLDELEVAEHILNDVLDDDGWSIEQTETGSATGRTLDALIEDAVWYASRGLQKFGKGVLTIGSKALLKEFLYEMRWRSQPANGHVLQEAARSIVVREREARGQAA